MCLLAYLLLKCAHFKVIWNLVEILIKEKHLPSFYIGYVYLFLQVLILGSRKTKTLGTFRILKNMLKRKHPSESEKSEAHLVTSLGNPAFLLQTQKTCQMEPIFKNTQSEWNVQYLQKTGCLSGLVFS